MGLNAMEGGNNLKLQIPSLFGGEGRDSDNVCTMPRLDASGDNSTYIKHSSRSFVDDEQDALLGVRALSELNLIEHLIITICLTPNLSKKTLI